MATPIFAAPEKPTAFNNGSPDGLDGLGRLRAEIGDTPAHEIAAHDMPEDQASLPPWQHATTKTRGLPPQNADPGIGPNGIVMGGALDDSDVQAAIAGLYGAQFPLLNASVQDKDWVNWAEQLWQDFGAGVQATLHLVERNRLFYRGNQWVSSVGFGPWREPMKPRDVVRAVRNIMKPALDMRTQLLAEQRPGFSATPANGDPKSQERAEANQTALEWSWHEQSMTQVAQEAGHRVGTDGVTFLELYWDPDAGPWYQVPPYVTPENAQFPIGKKPGQQFPLGDVRTKVRSIEQVRVSPDATSNHPPMIWVVREEMSKMEAISEHGVQVGKESGMGATTDDMANVPGAKGGYVLPQRNELLRDHEKVVRFIVYCDRSEFLPHGLMLVAVGQQLVAEPQPLPYGVIPMVRWTDGSADPSFYPLACCMDWIESQQRINAIVSKWLESIRKGSAANFLGRGGMLSGETLIGGTLNVFEVKNLPVGTPVSDVMQPIGPFDISASAERELAQEVKAIEDLTGYNDATRGSFTADQSGRAILAVREQVERVFAPFVNAASAAMVDWAEKTLAIMHANYDLPRAIAIQGQNRPDLGRLIASDDIDVAAQIWVDPETLMPMPRSLRLAVLDDMLQKQLISPQEYRRRMPFAMVQSLDTPDSDQSARAHRIAEVIKRTGSDASYPILWMDDEAQHQDVLERQIIFDDTLKNPVRAVAYERWMRLAQQAQMKQQGMQLPPGEPQQQQAPQNAQQPPQQAQGGALPGQTTASGLQGPNRFLGPANASGQSGPVAYQPLLQSGNTDQTQAAARFEQTAPH